MTLSSPTGRAWHWKLIFFLWNMRRVFGFSFNLVIHVLPAMITNDSQADPSKPLMNQNEWKSGFNFTSEFIWICNEAPSRHNYANQDSGKQQAINFYMKEGINCKHWLVVIALFVTSLSQILISIKLSRRPWRHRNLAHQNTTRVSHKIYPMAVKIVKTEVMNFDR